MNKTNELKILVNKANKAFKHYLNTLDKEEAYLNLAEIYSDIFNFNCMVYLNLEDYGISKEDFEVLKVIKQKIKFVSKEFEKEYYLNWIKSDNKKIVLKRAAGFEGQLSTFYRKYNFELISHNDPFTEDEIKYISHFYNDIFEEKNVSFSNLSLNQIELALYNLITN